MEQTLMQNLLTLGIGGVIAALVLMWKREDDKRYAEDVKVISERYATEMKAMAERFEKLAQESAAGQKDQTAALQRMAVAVEKLCIIDTLEKRMNELEAKLRRKGGVV